MLEMTGDEFANENNALPPPLDLSGWRKLPAVLMAGGAVLSVIGAVVNPAEFGFSWLLAFMFFLSIALGALFLVMVHHLTDAGWSVATRRVCEHIASLLFPWLALLFLPVAFFAKHIYSWMTMDPPRQHRSLSAKWPVFTMPGFYITSAIFFGLWWLLSSRLALLVAQAGRNRRRALHAPDAFPFGLGDRVMFALTLTFSGVLWMQAVQYLWFSAIYGVYFFASCVWVALAAVYVITVLLQRQRILDRVLHNHQFYFLGLLFFAFTVFQATSSSRNISSSGTRTCRRNLLVSHPPKRFVVVGGHDFHLRPFPAAVLRAAAGEGKTNFKIMLPVCAWALAMNFRGPVVQHPARAASRRLSVPMALAATRLSRFHGRISGLGFPEEFQPPCAVPAKGPAPARSHGNPYIEPEEISGAPSISRRCQ
jgi:hypothetical protein